MNKDVKLIMSIGNICIAYGCMALITCAIGGLSYKFGQVKSKLEITQILNEYLKTESE